MTAPITAKLEADGAAALAGRLARTTEAALDHACMLARALLEDGDAWHAGQVSGIVACLRGVARTAELVDCALNGKQLKEIESGIRLDTKQDAPHKGQMQLM